MTHFTLINHVKGPISKQSHTEVLALGLQHMDLGTRQLSSHWRVSSGPTPCYPDLSCKVIRCQGWGRML